MKNVLRGRVENSSPPKGPGKGLVFVGGNGGNGGKLSGMEAIGGNGLATNRAYWVGAWK
jgi:hypothetical protein